LFNPVTTRRKRARKRGTTVVQTALATAAIMGCFVYPASMALRAAGKSIADQSERGHAAMLEQAQ
jgi:hypothetical protein